MSMRETSDIRRLTRIYEESLRSCGDTPQGVLWPDSDDLATRFEVLLQPILPILSAGRTLRLLDVGCGPGFLLDYLQTNQLIQNIDYLGIDVSAATLAAAQKRWPAQQFQLRDIREAPFPAESFDFAIACGVFTAKFGLSYNEMRMLAESTLQALWPSCKIGLSFNFMSKHVDWERDDLFHWPLDAVMAFCKSSLSRHAAFRLDYGLWEVATMVHREPQRRTSQVPREWHGGA